LLWLDTIHIPSELAIYCNRLSEERRRIPHCISGDGRNLAIYQLSPSNSHDENKRDLEYRAEDLKGSASSWHSLLYEKAHNIVRTLVSNQVESGFLGIRPSLHQQQSKQKSTLPKLPEGGDCSVPVAFRQTSILLMSSSTSFQ
jgi:hypothetical protein